MFARSGIINATHGIELAEVKSENDHQFCSLGLGVEFCDVSASQAQSMITGQSRQILFKWLPPQTQDLHGFFLHRNMNPQTVIDESRPMLTEFLCDIGLCRETDSLELSRLLAPFSTWI
jgi:hypothetical protein